MRKIQNRSICFLTMICLTLVLLLPMTAWAEGTTTIYLSQSSISTGSKVSVTVEGSEKSDITVKYNTEILSYLDCDASGASASGNAVTFTGTKAVITFSGLKEGTSNIIVSSNKLAGSSTVVTVGSSSLSEETTEDTDSAEDTVSTDDAAVDGDNASTTDETLAISDTETTQVSSGAYVGTQYMASTTEGVDFDIDGTGYVVSERYTDAEMPAGFSRTSISIHGKTISTPKNDKMTLLDLKPASNTSQSGIFFIYDESTDSVYPMYLLGSASEYVILKNADTLPTNLEGAMCEYNGSSIPCYKVSGIDNDFFFVYGLNQDQTEQWYQIDTSNSTIQRANMDLVSMIGTGVSEDTATEDTETEEAATETEDTTSFNFKNFINTNKTMIGIIIFIIVVVVVVAINIVLRRRDDDDIFDDDDFLDRYTKNTDDKERNSDEKSDEASDDDSDEDFGKKSKKKKHLFGRKKDDDVFGDDDYDDDLDENEESEDDYDDLEEEKPKKKFGLFGKHKKDDDDFFDEDEYDEDASDEDDLDSDDFYEDEEPKKHHFLFGRHKDEEVFDDGEDFEEDFEENRRTPKAKASKKYASTQFAKDDYKNAEPDDDELVSDYDETVTLDDIREAELKTTASKTDAGRPVERATEKYAIKKSTEASDEIDAVEMQDNYKKAEPADKKTSHAPAEPVSKKTSHAPAEPAKKKSVKEVKLDVIDFDDL